MENFEIIIASVPNRDKVVAEIWYGDDLIAEINQEHDNLEIELYVSQKNIFDYQEFSKTLDTAKNKLMRS